MSYVVCKENILCWSFESDYFSRNISSHLINLGRKIKDTGTTAENCIITTVGSEHIIFFKSIKVCKDLRRSTWFDIDIYLAAQNNYVFLPVTVKCCCIHCFITFSRV